MDKTEVMGMRDTRKTASYFEAYVKYEKNRIEHRCEKLSSCESSDKKVRINENLLLNRMNLLIASFSCGIAPDELRKLYQQACSTACEVNTLTYSDALTLASFSIMLDDSVSIQPLFEKFGKLFSADKLLSGLRTYTESGKATWTGDYNFPTPYAGLDAVIGAEDKAAKEQAMLIYLSGWYAQCEECAWYDTENNPNDVYYGYWSFESAAVAKIYGLDPTICAQNPYFPVL